MKVNLVDLDSTLRSTAPPHLRIVDVVKLLFRPLKQNHRSVEPRRRKILGPVGLLPVGASRSLPGQKVNLVFRQRFVRGKSFRELLTLDLTQPTAIVVHFPS